MNGVVSKGWHIAAAALIAYAIYRSPSIRAVVPAVLSVAAAVLALATRRQQ